MKIVCIEKHDILGGIIIMAGSLLFRALANRAGNFEKLLAQNLLNLPITGICFYFSKKVPASRAGTYQILLAHHENYPPLNNRVVTIESRLESLFSKL